MSARRVLRRSGSSNGYDADDGDVVIAACCTFAGGGDGELVDDRFSRRAHTSFMAHFRFCLLTNDPSPAAVVPMGELLKI